MFVVNVSYIFGWGYVFNLFYIFTCLSNDTSLVSRVNFFFNAGDYSYFRVYFLLYFDSNLFYFDYNLFYLDYNLENAISGYFLISLKMSLILV